MKLGLYKEGFSKSNYFWDISIRFSIIPLLIFGFISIFMNDDPISPVYANIPLISCVLYLLFYIVYLIETSKGYRLFEQKIIEENKIPIYFKIIPLLFLTTIIMTFIILFLV